MSREVIVWYPDTDGNVWGEAREQVVRCRDCAHRCKAWNGQTPNFIVNWFCSYTGGHEVKPDGFCAWGEKGGDNIA